MPISLYFGIAYLALAIMGMNLPLASIADMIVSAIGFSVYINTKLRRENA